jgi:hypothetical protein
MMRTDFCRQFLTASAALIACPVAIVLVCVSGCGGKPVPAEYSGPPAVSGKVSMDGVALAAVTVSFKNSEGGPFQAVSGADGRYALEEGAATPSLGKYLVRLTSGSGDGAESSSLPARYNTETELIVGVLPGENSIDFALSSSSESDVEVE